MRTAFVRALEDVAAADPRVWLLTGDLGYRVLDGFAERFPNRFINVGVAEQNLVGVAAGLALSGKQVWVYSIVNFPVMRALEQIRNDLAYHRLNVKIVTVGGGLVYGAHGYSHHGAEDLAVMRLMPHMEVWAPGDPHEAAWATHSVAHGDGPAYLRLARGGEPNIHALPFGDWEPGRPIQLREGIDATIASTGGTLALSMKAADVLASRGKHVAVFSVPRLQPLDPAALFESARTTQRLLSVEDHGRGGLGTMLAERIAEAGEPFRFLAMRLRNEPVTVAGSNDELLARHGITPSTIADAACLD